MPDRLLSGSHSALNRVAIAAVLCAASTLAFAQVITEFPIPSPDADTWDICAGPDGAVWFNEPGANKIGRITTDGMITEFPTPGGAYGLTSGPDGNIWFTTGGQVGRLTPSGQLTTFEVPDSENSAAYAIVTGSDGNLWYGDLEGRIGRVTPQGTFTVFPLPVQNSEHGIGGPYDVTLGPDGAVWYAFPGASSVGRIRPDGTITNYLVPQSTPFGITAGSDGELWFDNAHTISHISTSGQLQDVTDASNGGFNFTIGSDGNVWFSELGALKIARITRDGVVTEFDLPPPHATGVIGAGQAWGITSGPDGNIWYVLRGDNRVGRLEIPGHRQAVDPVHRSAEPRTVPPRP